MTKRNGKLYKKRRTKHKLCQLYKMINGLTPAYLQQLIPETVQQLSRYSLFETHKTSLPVSRTVTYSTSFLPSTIRDWNSLSTDLKNAASISSFTPTHYVKAQLSRAGQLYHTRLRLECSSLNYHLYQKNLIDNPYCTCGQLESSTHFFSCSVTSTMCKDSVTWPLHRTFHSFYTGFLVNQRL